MPSQWRRHPVIVQVPPSTLQVKASQSQATFFLHGRPIFLVIGWEDLAAQHNLPAEQTTSPSVLANCLHLMYTNHTFHSASHQLCQLPYCISLYSQWHYISCFVLLFDLLLQIFCRLALSTRQQLPSQCMQLASTHSCCLPHQSSSLPELPSPA